MRQLTLLLAIGFDGLLGDPPNRLHPVAWMGRFIQWLGEKRPYDNPPAEFGFGARLTLLGAGLSAGAGWLCWRGLALLPLPLRVLAEAVLLKTTFSVRGLWRASGAVQTALAAADLPEARRLLGWHLVSRNTAELSPSQVAAATIESVAENCSDSVTAPLLAYALGGLPLALAYRFVNTMDAMLGYRDPAREWLGKFPARLDDLLNWVPARLTGLLLALVGWWGGNGRLAYQIMRRDAAKTDSPNAGYPMSAMAGALGVELEKTGQYRLGEGLRRPETADIERARRYFLAVVGVLVGMMMLGRRKRDER